MKRRQFFEFEDQTWFPDFLRVCMTRYIAFIHRLFCTASKIEGPLGRLLEETGRARILDLCSGSGGPMLEVYQTLKGKKNFKALELTMSDLYPNEAYANEINNLGDKQVSYSLDPIDASDLIDSTDEIRTMISSFHHMPIEVAKRILRSSRDSRSPIFIYEMSDNSHPLIANWITLPIGVLMVLVFAPFVRPMTFTQLIFTYFLPVLPFIIAWDAAVSNIRTYTKSDIEELTIDLEGEFYSWQTIELAGKGGKSIILIGKPFGEKI